MRKFIAKILLVVLFVSNIPMIDFDSSQSTLQAAGPLTISPNYRRNLYNSDSSPAPVQNIQPTLVPDDTVYMEFELPGSIVNMNSAGGGGVIFSYLIDKSTKVEFTIRHAPVAQEYSVYFDLFTLNNNSWTKVSNEGMKLWWQPSRAFISTENFKNYTASNSDFHLEWVNGADGTDGYYFVGTLKTGLSIDFYGKQFFFLLNEDTNGPKFEYTANGLDRGIVYNFYTYQYDGASSSNNTLLHKIPVSTGINTKTLDFIPFSTDDSGVIIGSTNIFEDPAKYQVTSLRNDGYYLTHDTLVKEKTAQNPGLAVRFDDIMELSYAKGTQLTEDRTQTGIYKILDQNEYDLTSTLRMNDQGVNLMAKVTNVLGVQPDEVRHYFNSTNPTYDLTYPGSGIDRDQSFIRKLNIAGLPSDEPGRYEMRLYGLSPNTLFSEVQMEIEIKYKGTDTKVLEAVPKTMPLGSAFTFLDYTFVFMDDKYNIQIQPYRGFKGVYAFQRAGSPISYTEGTDGAPINFEISSAGLDYYQIYFAPGASITNLGGVDWDAAVYSERTNYRPDPADWEIGSPKEFQVLDYLLKPDTFYTQNYGHYGFLDLDLKWYMASSEDLKRYIKNVYTNTGSPAQVVYDINKSLTGSKDDIDRFATVTVNLWEEPVGSGQFYAQYSYTLEHDNNAIIYNSERQELIAENAYLPITVKLENIYAERAVMDVTNEGSRFFYPRIYYINAITQPSNLEKISTFESITLNDLVEGDLPPLRNLQNDTSKTTNNGFTITWNVPSNELQEYIDKTPLFDDRDFTVNIYMSQSEDLMVDFTRKYLTMEDRKNNSTKYEIGQVSPNGMDMAISPSILDALRNEDSVLRFEGYQLYNLYDPAEKEAFFTAVKNGDVITPSSDISGLDPNQKYFIYVTLEAVNYYTNNGINYEDVFESMLSNLHGITTSDDPDVPGGEDKRPGAPSVNIKDVSIDSATVYWNYADLPAENSSEEVYYEIIRTKSSQINSRYLDSYIDIADFYQTLKAEMPLTEMEFFRTNESVRSDGKYTPDIFNGSTYQAASVDQYELLIGDEGIQLVDKTLQSNQIYFYYVRTVRVVNDKILHSVWGHATCTTDNLAPPINLMMEQDASFNRKTEFVISFDAPMTNLDMLGTEFNIEYQIKKDAEDYGNVQVFDVSTLRQNATDDGPEGYIHFTYKISGLEQGTQYAIRIRMAAIKTADRSAWTLPAITRTDMDQDEFDDNKEADAWMEFYIKQLEMLMKKDYWTIQDTKSKFGAVYRPTMFEQVLGTTADGTIVLPKGSFQEAYQFTYYIPAAALTSANYANKGFILQFGEMEIVVSPGAVSTENNESIFSIMEKLADSSLKDYYLMVNMEFKKTNQTIHNQPAISDNLVLEFEIVGSRDTTINWDNSILNLYLERIEREKNATAIRNRIITMLRRNDSAAEIEKYIFEKVDDFKFDLFDRTSSSHRSNTKNSYKIDTLDKAIIIGMTTPAQAVAASGFKYISGAWTAIDTFDYKSGKGFYTNTPGSYIFAGVVVEIPGINGQSNAGTTYAIVAKYGLTDFLGVDGNINVDAPATRRMVLNSAARMMSAPKGSDPVVFLKGKGYNISGAAMDTVATSQETVYLVMAVYEVKTGTKANTIAVRNYNLTAGITGMDERYKPSIRAAFELGIYTNTAMEPKAGVSIKDLLDILTALDNRANL